MKIKSESQAYGKWLIVLFVTVIGILMPMAARAQQTGTTVDECSSEIVDSNTGVEQTVCLSGDQSELEAYVEVDNYGGGNSWNFADEVGASGYLSGPGVSSDVGDQCCSSWISAGGSIVPQINQWYYLTGYYDEDVCDENYNCYFESGMSGLSVAVEVTSSSVTSVNSSSNPSAYGSSTSLNALVSTGGTSPAPTGSVTFTDDGSTLGTATVSSVSTTNLIPYSQSIMAAGSSWGGYCAASNSNVTADTGDIAAPDGSYTATKFVMPGGSSCGAGGAWGALIAAPSGLTTNQTYTASIWLKGGTGGESVALFLNDCSGDNPITLTNSWVRYSFTVAATSNIASCGRGLQFIGNVSSNQTFYVWGAQLEASVVVGPYVLTSSSTASGYGGLASLSTSFLPMGSSSVTAQYSGDSATPPSTGQVSVTVNHAPTLTTVTSSINPSRYGNSVILSALVSTGGATPTGSATFTDGGSSIGTASISQVSTTNLIPYSQSIMAAGSSWGGYCASNNSNVTPGTGDTAAPDGTYTATKFVMPGTSACGAGGAFGALIAAPSGLTTNQTYTASIWLKGASGGEGVAVEINDCAYVGTATLTTSWVRYSITVAAISAITSCGTGARGFQFIGNASTNQTFYAWGAQLEQSSSVGPYVLTAESVATGYGGVASLSTSSLALGSHSLVAEYPGDSDTTSSASSALIQVVTTPPVFDSGTIQLTVNGVAAATATYGSESTPESVAQALVSGVTGGSAVNLSAIGGTLYMQAKQVGAGTNYSYSLQATSWDSSDFSQPSFVSSPISGLLAGGADASPAAPQTVYDYTANSYDPAGNLTRYSDSVMGAWSLTDGYDSLNRLVQMQNTGTTPTSTQYANEYGCWQYDAFGNRLYEALSATACTSNPSKTSWASYDTSNSNRMDTTQLNPSQGAGYDDAGNLTNDGVNQYLYDAEGRICAVSHTPVPGFTTMTGYLYDAEGRRVMKGTITAWSCDPGVNGIANATNETDEILDAQGNQVTELSRDSNGAMTWQHSNVWMQGHLLGTVDTSGLHFYIDDPLGTRRVQTDMHGSVEQTCNSLPFGDGETCSPNPTEHLFTGKEHDSESGNDYFKARYYASSMGRFLTPDPSGLQYADPSNPQSLNLYSYVRNNPLTFIDPSGMWGCSDNKDELNMDDGDDGCEMFLEMAEWASEQTTAVQSNGRWYSWQSVQVTDGECSMSNPICELKYRQLTAQINRIPQIGTPNLPIRSAPNNGPPTRGHCLGQALMSDGNGASVGLDLLGIGAGFLPGGGLVTGSARAATFAFGAQVGLTAASTGVSIAYKSGPGMVAGILGGQVALTSKSAEALAVDFGKSIPIVGVAVSTGALLYDGYQTYEAYSGCLTGGH